MARLFIKWMWACISVANVIAFSILVIEITNCKLTGKQPSVITVSCFRTLLLQDGASECNNFDTNLLRKD